MPGGDNAGLVAYFLDELWNKQNLAVIDQLTVENYVLHIPQGDLVGREALKLVITHYFEHFSLIHLSIGNQTSQDPQVVTFLGWDTALKFVMQPLALDQAIERKIPTRGVSIDRIVNGQIVESWSMLDMLYWLSNTQALSRDTGFVLILPEVTECPCPRGYNCVNNHCVLPYPWTG